MKRAYALSLAQELVARLDPTAERIQIAGSLRRGEPEVGDIEVLMIPKPPEPARDLFGDPVGELEFDITPYLGGGWDLARLNPRNGPRWKRLRYESGVDADLFITDERRWGAQVVIRTGPAEFSKSIVMLANRLGMHFTDLLLHQHPKLGGNPCAKGESCPLIIPTPDETAVFDALGLPDVEPVEEIVPGGVWHLPVEEQASDGRLRGPRMIFFGCLFTAAFWAAVGLVVWWVL